MEKILSPEKEFKLPYDKNSLGMYQIIPRKRNSSSITQANKKRFPDGYIYLIKIDGQPLYKIGVSRNVKRRIQDISSYLPYDLQILSIHYFKDVYDLEESLSKEYKQFIERKEWYRFTVEQAKEIMIKLHNLNVVIEDKNNGQT